MGLAAGDRLGPYEILAPLGAGGMGEVYRARDTRLGREVAVKVLPGRASPRDAERLRRFEQEARAAGGLDHPNIAAVYDVGRHDGTPYVVSELLEGETLRARLAEARCRRAGPSIYAHPDRPGPRRGARARGSSTGTSSRRTCSSPGTAGSRSSTSASPS